MVLLDRAEFKSRYLAHGHSPSLWKAKTVWNIYCKGPQPQSYKRAFSQGNLLAWHKRDLLKYLKYSGPGQLSPFHESRTLTSGHSTRVRWDRESGHWGTAERTAHPLCPSAIQPTPLRFVISRQFKPWIFLRRQWMQELMTLLTALTLVALPAVASSTQCSACVHLFPAYLGRGCISPAPTLPRGSHYSLALLLACSKQPAYFLLFPKKQQLCFQRDPGVAHVNTKKLCCPLMVASCSCGPREVSPHFLAVFRPSWN